MTDSKHTPTPTAGEYRCAMCQQVYTKGWADDEAREELEDNFPGWHETDCDVVCDDCYQRYFDWRCPSRRNPVMSQSLISELREDICSAAEHRMDLLIAGSTLARLLDRIERLEGALRAIVDQLDEEDRGEAGLSAADWIAHWQSLHDNAIAALEESL